MGQRLVGASHRVFMVYILGSIAAPFGFTRYLPHNYLHVLLMGLTTLFQKSTEEVLRVLKTELCVVWICFNSCLNIKVLDMLADS